MTQNSTNGAPRQIAIIHHSPAYCGAPKTPRLIRYGGPVFPLIDGHGPRYHQLPDRTLLVEGHLYRYERNLGERADDTQRDAYYFGYSYRLMEGWQVLTSHNGDQPAPELQHPTADRAEADDIARRRVTSNLILGTTIKAIVVWQDGHTYSEPFATCDGTQHTYGQAVHARAQNTYLPLQEHDPPPIEKGEAPTSPENENPSQRNPQGHYITNGSHRQAPNLEGAIAIRPVWGSGNQTDIEYPDRQRQRVNIVHSQMAIQAQALGWSEPIDGSGFWMSPAYQ